jgi:hypothetical protein
MRKHLMVAGIAVAALLPTLALAQQSCEQQRDNRVAGTVVGAGIGALLGSAVAGHGDRTAGAIVGGVGGAVVGNQLSKPNADCAHAYGYYDRSNQWHASNVDRGIASGYYDRDGNWVDGAPNGYYAQSGRWIGAKSDAPDSGYYDGRGHWVPASASGYYDDTGQWNSTASGYWDDNHRWIAGPASGAYDANGRWVRGAVNGHRDSNGAWIADAQPGYYDQDGVWRAGQVYGYYDDRGRWTGANGVQEVRRADSYGSDASYSGDRMDAPRDLHTRESWLEQRIRDGQNNGTLRHRDARQAMYELNSIRARERGMSHDHGQLRPRDEAYLQSRLDALGAMLRRQDTGGRATY